MTPQRKRFLTLLTLTVCCFNSITVKAQSTGQWTAPIPWPIVTVHMSVLPNGKVLAW